MDAESIRTQQRRSWDDHSEGWGKWDEVVSGMLAPIGDLMLRLLDPPPGGDHLDLACGTGEPGLVVAAEQGGKVTLTDISAGMVRQAERKAAARGLDNVRFQVCSADELPFPDGSFDSATCRLGLMFMPDPVAAAAEIKRVLRPGGRVCAAVWAEPEGNPWATIPMQAIAAEVDLPAPEPDGPGMFRFSTPGAAAQIFERAGFGDVREMQLDDVGVVATPDVYWEFTRDVAGPIVAALADVDEATRARVEADVMRRVETYRSDGRLALPIRARCAVATRPG